jgi:hypothetical protein
VKIWTLAFALLGVTSSLWGQVKKPNLAICGPEPAATEFLTRILSPESGTGKTFVHQVLPNEDLNAFQSVVFVERDETAISASGGWTIAQWKLAEDYVQKGGRILFCRYGISTVSPKRELGFGSLLTGIRMYPDLKGSTSLHWTTAGKAWGGELSTREPDPAWLGANNPVADPLPQAQVLIEATDSTGKPVAFLTRQATGSGEVFFLGTSLYALKKSRASDESVSSLIRLIKKVLALPST